MRIRSGCPVRGEERALKSNIYYGSGAFIVNIALEARLIPANAAIEKISDIALLKRIALEYEDGRSCTALARISDQQVLKEIVLNVNRSLEQSTCG